MSSIETPAVGDRPQYKLFLRGTLILMALLVVARFVLEVAGTPQSVARFISSTAALVLAGIYLGAIAPLRGVKKVAQLILPAIVVTAWTITWVILATVISGAASLQNSHFAEKEDWGNWAHLGRHLVGHLIEVPIVSLLLFIFMLIPFLLWRWPVIVAPAAVLGGLVVMRFWMEAMGVEAWRAAAWSSTVGILIAAFYLGGMGPRLGATTPLRLLAPSLALAWTWRLWVFLATLFSALAPFFKTHFFDPSGGHVAARLASFFLFGVVIEGLVAGLIVWGIACWISRATQPAK